MRSEQEMHDLILSTARQDERIRAVTLNGSRANPNAGRDPFQDFDVVYFVTDPRPFHHAFDWIQRFGPVMILQLPDDMHEPPRPPEQGFAYLMQFMDGNRIDLTITPLDRRDERLHDSLTRVLLDKDGLIPPLDPPSEKDYLPQPPTAKEFAERCNEFWWCCPYVAKGLWRGQIPYARFMLDSVVREELMKMLHWYVGVRTGFTENPGTFGKYLQDYLEPDLWEALLKTYADADPDHTWDALDATCDLFRQVARPVAAHFGFDYPDDYDRRVSAHLKHVRDLPKDAKEIY